MKLKEAVRRAPWAVAVLALSCAAGLLAARVAPPTGWRTPTSS